MEVRLNKLISDSGLCSRREADRFIELGRVTVNGTIPVAGQKVKDSDIVMLDDVRIAVGKYADQGHVRAAAGKTQNLVFGEKEKKEKKKIATPEKSNNVKTEKDKTNRPGKYGKYNKFAAARKAAQNGEKPKNESKEKSSAKEAKVVKEALQPKFGKSLSRSAVAQRIAASPKSASLRKTSKNNPLNKAKRGTTRNKPKEE